MARSTRMIVAALLAGALALAGVSLSGAAHAEPPAPERPHCGVVC